MSGRRLKRLLEAEPLDERAEGRAWETVRAAFSEREPLGRRRPRIRVALVLSALAAVVAAASFSPPGRAVVNAVRRTIGIRHAQPALFELPAPGRLLVAGQGGAWVVAADGSKRSLGDYRQAAWSPHGLFVVAAAANELAALEPAGSVRWTLARPQVRFPVWGGTRTDTRIAYLAGSRLHVVAGDSTGDVAMAGLPAAAGVAPAWQPTTADRHILAYVTTRGRVVVVDTDRGSVRWTSAGYAGPHALAWSRDGARLALAAKTKVVVFDASTGRATTIHVEDVSALAFSTDGRLALLRRHAVLLRDRGHTRTLFVPPGAIAGLAWSPNGRWLLTGLPGADEWIFLQTRGGHRILAVSHITAQFGAFPTLSGWAG